jgi:adenine phosphoribosyltransferase
VTEPTEPTEPSARELVSSLIRSIPDFPEPGVTFRDLTPVFASGPALHALGTSLTEPFAGRFDDIGGVEARGFLIAGAASAICGAGVLTVRKAGKLPRAVLREEYSLEYGTAALEVHEGELPPGARVLIVDDVLATGGTAAAATQLVKKLGGTLHGLAFLIELVGLNGKSKLAGEQVYSVLQY